MIGKLTRTILRTFAFALALCATTSAWAAAKPKAIWFCDFADNAERGGYTFALNRTGGEGNTISSGVVTIGNSLTSGGGATIMTTEGKAAITAVAGFSNLPSSTDTGTAIRALVVPHNANFPNLIWTGIDNSVGLGGNWYDNVICIWGDTGGGRQSNLPVGEVSLHESSPTYVAASVVAQDSSTTGTVYLAGIEKANKIYTKAYTVNGFSFGSLYQKLDDTTQHRDYFTLTSGQLKYVAIIESADANDVDAWSLTGMTSAGTSVNVDDVSIGVNLPVAATLNTAATAAAMFVQQDSTLTISNGGSITLGNEGDGPLYIADGSSLTIDLAGATVPTAENPYVVIVKGKTYGANQISFTNTPENTIVCLGEEGFIGLLYRGVWTEYCSKWGENGQKVFAWRSSGKQDQFHTCSVAEVTTSSGEIADSANPMMSTWNLSGMFGDVDNAGVLCFEDLDYVTSTTVNFSPFTLGGLFVTAGGSSLYRESTQLKLGARESGGADTYYFLAQSFTLNPFNRANNANYFFNKVNICALEGATLTLPSSGIILWSGSDGRIATVKMSGAGFMKTDGQVTATGEVTLDFSDLDVNRTKPFIQGNLTVDDSTKYVFPADLPPCTPYKLCSGTLTGGNSRTASITVGNASFSSARLTFEENTVSYQLEYTGTISGDTPFDEIEWSPADTTYIGVANVVINGSGMVTGCSKELTSIEIASGVTFDMTDVTGSPTTIGSGTFLYTGNYSATVPAGVTYKYVGGNSVGTTATKNGVTVNGALKTSGYLSLATFSMPSGGSLDVLDGSTRVAGSSQALQGDVIVRDSAKLVYAQNDLLDYAGSTRADIYGTLEINGSSTRLLNESANMVLNFYGGSTITGSGFVNLAKDRGFNVKANPDDATKDTVYFQTNLKYNYSSSTSTITIDDGVTLELSSGSVYVHNSDTRGGITKAGGGKIVLGSTLTATSFVATLNVSAGEAEIADAFGGAVVVASGATLTVSGVGPSITNPLTLDNGSTLKFGTSVNLSVDSIALPGSGTVTVDIGDLTLSASGNTLITFTSAPSAEDVANKMTVSGAVLRLEDSALKAYPIAVLKKANGDDVVFSTVQEAVDATATLSYYDYQYITVNLDGQTVNAVDMTLKVKYGAGVSSLIVNSSSSEYESDGGVTDGESGVTTYSLTPAATTYTWVATGEGVKNWTTAANWTYGSGSPAPATRCPTAIDSVVFNNGASVTRSSDMDIVNLTVNGEVTFTATERYELKFTGSVDGTGTLTLDNDCLKNTSGVAQTIPFSINFVNGARLAGPCQITITGNVSIANTFEVWGTTHIVSGNVTVANGSTIQTAASGNNGALTVTGTTTLNGSFTKTSQNTLTLGNVVVSASTTPTIESGTIAINGTVTVLDGAMFTIPPSGLTVGDSASFVLSGRSSVLVDNGSDASGKVSTSMTDGARVVSTTAASVTTYKVGYGTLFSVY